ncbi:MAG TPA: VOC family protein [Anaerolineales bacterium]|nr:VOC family protein [Anaerolineales bacterium]HRQ91883.1 VOC family protein [Anaerolineales bacterium]
MQKIVPFLVFNNGRGAQALEFYASVFKDANISKKTLSPDGQLFMGTVQLHGQEFHAIDAPGENFQFSEGISFMINCANAEEVDYFWERLVEDGGEHSMCGWLKDRFGVSWQVVPTLLGELMQDPDPEKVDRVVQAMLKMQKLDTAALQAAYDNA